MITKEQVKMFENLVEPHFKYVHHPSGRVAPDTIECMLRAYNLGIEHSANSAEAILNEAGGSHWATVDEESILKNIIK